MNSNEIMKCRKVRAVLRYHKPNKTKEPATVFVSTGLPEKRVRIAKSEQELEELDDESTEIFKSNVIE